MPGTGIEIIGMISTTLASEIYGKSIITGAVDPGFIAEFARAHEDGGFDRVLIGYGSTGPDGFAGRRPRRDRDGAARLADRAPAGVRGADARRAQGRLRSITSTGGRIALHIITGGSDVELQRDGDFLDRTPATGAPTSTSTSCGAIVDQRPRRSTTRASSTR